IGLTAIIAIGPAVWVQDHNMPLPGSQALTEQEQRGLAIYVAEGCLYCHTQQVRPLDLDAPFGRPSAPGDYARLRPQDIWRMTPGMLGTERTGPDLSDVGNRQPSDTWQYIHLYNPRAVIKESVMQAYPWYFETKQIPDPKDIVVPVPQEFAPREGKIIATQKAKDLVAYILSLKQVPIPGVSTVAQAQPSGPAGPEAGLGAKVYQAHCASCHQVDGQGLPGAFPALKGDHVVIDKDATRHIEIVLFGLQGETIGGVQYTSPMPAQAQTLTDSEIAAVVNHERTSWGNNAVTVTAQDVAKVRQQKGVHEE
ncbi:MAG TPA: cbb3-type cytochrome c oxidase subunit II, partial [Nitrospirota bacterium]|nr:cbb3-type cytochrome c oxidase subunit II [Nitrospirota bacterium]